MSHPIKGTTTLEVAGETRTLACDMNCAAVLFELKGEFWNEWLVKTFLGERVVVDGVASQQVSPLTPKDTITALYALLATDREESGRVETESGLRRSLSLAGLPDITRAALRCVLTGFGLPGEFIEAVVGAAEEPRAKAAKGGTGTKP